ncbi:hypothetical protein M747DRAFT_341724 [Aspergillus niger ATCC 13496]|uniref:Uncharacterized protein n=1 Tax=Aspergillus niger ATCC 13496 TaxID=1353008 RepID=A0A370C413_ASPNG|nr:hypothetical protein M747DRAFT_341724 [Aspergillus niger ATCC 13496]
MGKQPVVLGQCGGASKRRTPRAGQRSPPICGHHGASHPRLACSSLLLAANERAHWQRQELLHWPSQSPSHLPQRQPAFAASERPSKRPAYCSSLHSLDLPHPIQEASMSANPARNGASPPRPSALSIHHGTDPAV